MLEIEGGASGDTFVTRLFASGTLETGAPQPRLGDALARRVVAGGFAAALQRATHARRERWLREYLDALIEKDLRELFTLQRPDVIAPLLEAAAARTARLFNASDLASPFALTRQTISAYLRHLENVFLIDRLPPWHSNRTSRLVKTPKLHLTDTGLASALLGVDPDTLSTAHGFTAASCCTTVSARSRSGIGCSRCPTANVGRRTDRGRRTARSARGSLRADTAAPTVPSRCRAFLGSVPMRKELYGRLARCLE